MAHKFFYAWQSERPGSVCRYFIRDVLESISNELQQLGVDERIEIDFDTQGVPGVPEILNTILKKIEGDDVFVADLTVCSESFNDERPRRSPNSNVMFEYGYAMKAKGRDKIICVMNDFYGGKDPSELPFDLRHARAPIRYSLAPDFTSEQKEEAHTKLRRELLVAARLIIENLPSTTVALPHVSFEKPHFTEGQELTPEGDFPGQINPTFFDASSGFVYLRGRPIHMLTLSIAQIKQMEVGTAGLSISTGSSAGSFGTNKWGRISYSLNVVDKKRLSTDYAQ